MLQLQRGEKDRAKVSKSPVAKGEGVGRNLIPLETCDAPKCK